MKCPGCGTNHPLKRLGMTCACGYKFLFNPKTVAITDNQLQHLINKASANNTRYFTRESLYGLYLKTAGKAGNKLGLLILGVILAIIAGVVFDEYFWFFIALVLGIIFIKKQRRSGKPVAYNVFSSMLKKWQQGPLKSTYLLSEPSLSVPPPANAEGDIFDYGVEKIIMLDKDLTVDLLVKNNEHANAKALIISSNGYPNYLLEPLKKILAEKPDTPVMLLHAANTDQVRMLGHFKSRTGIDLNQASVMDLAINPEQIKSIKSFNHLKGHEQYATVDMLPYAALAGVAALGAAALLENYAAHAAYFDDDAFDNDFG